MRRAMNAMRSSGARTMSVLVVLAGFRASSALGQCPAPAAPALQAYQSGATTVELVVNEASVAGADHWEVSRAKAGGGTVALLPATIPAGTPSIMDDGQGLEVGSTYTYTLTVQKSGGMRSSATAHVIDVGNAPPLQLGSSLTLGDYFGIDPGTGQRINWWYRHFPSPIGRLYAKYLGEARAPSSSAALPCATVTVRVAGTSTPAALFADRWGKIARANPLTADRHGQFAFYADNGTYDVAVASGATSDTQAGVALFDARAAQTAHAAGAAAALTITTPEDPAQGPDGGVAIKLTRPHSSDGNDPPNPYRLLANQTENAWAMTYNLGIDEDSGAMTFDDPVDSAFFLRVHRPSAALEFGLDPGYGAADGGPWLPRAPELETLFHAGPDRVQFKSLLGAVGMYATATQSGLRAGDVVVLRKNGSVKRANRDRIVNPFAILAVDEPSGISRRHSPVYLAIAGRSFVRVLGSVAVDQPLVATRSGTARAASGETDARYIVGYARATGGATNIVSLMAANAW
jgi:hypothetical protein